MFTIKSYAYENGCLWVYVPLPMRLNMKNLSCLKSALENNCPWNQDTIYSAQNGNLKCLRQNRMLGIHTYYTATNGNLHCLNTLMKIVVLGMIVLADSLPGKNILIV